MHAYDVGFFVFLVLWLLSLIFGRLAARVDDIEGEAYFGSLTVTFSCMMMLMVGFSQNWW